MNYLGIDWGKAKIGLAVGDDELRIASPFGIVGGISRVIEVMKEEGIDRVVLGRPVKMDSSEVFLSEYEEFAARLSEIVDVDFIDERLSTKEASGLIREMKGGGKEDAVAAMIILQGYLDKL